MSIHTWGSRRCPIRQEDIAVQRAVAACAVPHGCRNLTAADRNASPRTVERPCGELRHGIARPTGSDCGQYSTGIISHRLGFNCIFRRLQARAAPCNSDLASGIHVPYQRVNELVNRRRGVTPSTALRLAKFFGVSADFWLNLQVRWDLFKAQSSEAEELRSIEDYHHLQKMA